jgi:hypothetical protein
VGTARQPRCRIPGDEEPTRCTAKMSDVRVLVGGLGEYKERGHAEAGAFPTIRECWILRHPGRTRTMREGRKTAKDAVCPDMRRRRNEPQNVRCPDAERRGAWRLQGQGFGSECSHPPALPPTTEHRSHLALVEGNRTQALHERSSGL